MYNLFRRIWSFWGAICFFGVYLILSPLYFLLLFPYRKAPKRIFQIVFAIHHVWAFSILTLNLCMLYPARRVKLKKGQAYIFVSNHRSYLDIPIIGLGVPRPLQYLGKAELAKVPLFGFMYKRMNVLVNRSGKSDRARSLVECGQSLQAGIDLCIFPEGTSKTPYDNRLAELRDGAFILALKHQVPIVPVTIINSNKALSNDGKFLLRPFVLFRTYADDPISVDGLTENDLETLKERVRAVIDARLKAYYG